MNNNPSDPQAVRLFKRMEYDVLHWRFLNIILEAVLIGLAFAIASVWSDVIVSTASHWLTTWAVPLQKLIAALFVTLFSIIAAVLAVFLLVVKPQEKAVEMARHTNIPRSRDVGYIDIERGRGVIAPHSRGT